MSQPEQSGKTAIVTGAGSGIGRAVARGLIGEGWRVALAGRRQAALAETAVGEPPDQVLVIPTDVTEPAAVKALFETVQQSWGRLDLLVNNAGISAPAVPLEDLTDEMWQSVVNVNLTAAFLCTREAFAVMKRQHPRGGRIINNGSISAHVPRPNSAPYTATKHAITGLTRSAALDGRPFDIACGQVDIGNAATDMTGRMASGVLQATGTVTAEPVIDVGHVVRAFLYMASLPLDVNVPFMTVMATKMPYIGRG